MKWISIEERLPDLIEGKDYSENVLAVCNNELMVMQLCFIRNDDDWQYYWCNCYGNIEGDGMLDDEYNPTHWMPLPELPKYRIDNKNIYERTIYTIPTSGRV